MDCEYIAYDLNLCSLLAKGAAGNESMAGRQAELQKYIVPENSSKKVAQMMDQIQKELLKGLRARAEKTLEITQVLGNTIAQRGIKYL